MNGLVKKIIGIISSYKYNSYKKELSKKQVLKLSPKGVIKARRKFNKFIDSLSSEEVVLFGTLYDKFWLELAFMEAIKYPEVKKLFERRHIEALQHYIIRGESEEAVNKRFFLNVDTEPSISDLVNKFKAYCDGVADVAVDNSVK